MRAQPEQHDFSLIAERYRTERELTRTTAATVLQVWDRTATRRLALKRLRPGASERQVALFQREFYTLASLRHPNAVEVYDFGVDDGNPYYTMELLEGENLCERAPMPWLEVCEILRQVAPVLGALHARRLLHRNLTARSLWRTRAGVIKLMHFSALSPFGIVSDLVGSPSFVPPEALYAQPLDERSDLYVLGALAYWLLTGKHAYPAQTYGDLARAWQKPPPTPSMLATNRGLSPIPRELEGLVEALLCQNPLSRPANTAELLDKLDVVARLDARPKAKVATDQLPNSAFVGRKPILQQLRTMLTNADAGVGGSIVIESALGMGRTRLLQEVSLKARLGGATVLHAAASVHQGRHGVALALTRQLLEVLPEQARQAGAPHAATLVRLARDIGVRLGSDPNGAPVSAADPAEDRVRIQAALQAWYLTIASERPLVLLVDDLHCIDEASAAWLASLAADAADHKLVIVATLLSDAESELAPAAQRFMQAARHVTLGPLSVAELRELLRSLFDEVPHLERLAARLDQRAQGCPALVLELAEHLVQSGVIRYEHGTWFIPQEVSLAHLPATRYEMIERRLDRLPAAARALGQVLSVQAGELPIEVCKALFEHDAGTSFLALEALVREGVLTGSPKGYGFRDARVRKRLLSELDGPRRRRAHLRLGEALLQRGQLTAPERLVAGLHLMRGGAEDRGAAIVVQAATQLKGLDSMAEVAVAIEEALALFRAAGRTKHELLVLLSRLPPAQYSADRFLPDDHGEEILALVDDVLGLRAARRMRPWLGHKLSAFLALSWASLGFLVRRNNPLVPRFDVAVKLLLEAVTALTATHAIRLNPEFAARCARTLEPFTALGPDHAASFVYEFCAALSLMVQDRPAEAARRWNAVLATLRSNKRLRNMPDDVHQRYLAGALYACGVLESLRESAHALAYAEQLDALNAQLYAMSADQIRMVYYAHRGKLALSERYRRRVELHAIRRGSAWQVETWAPGALVQVYLRTYDVVGMNRALSELRRLSQRVPSFEVLVRRATGAYLLLRGQPREALPDLEGCLHEEPLAVIGWARAHGTLAQAYNALGEHARAKQVCLAALSRISNEDLSFLALNLGLQIELALAEAGLSRSAVAAEQLDACLAQHGPHQSRLTLGALHEARARVALLLGDTAGYRAHLGEMRMRYLPTATATLIRRYDQLANAGDPRAARARPDADVALSQAASIDESFSEISSVRECAETALCILAQASATSEAYLFLKEPQGVSLAAKSSAREPPWQLEWWVSQCLEHRPPRAQEEGEGRQDGGPSATLVLGSTHYRLVLLDAPDSDPPENVGAAVLAQGEESSEVFDADALRVLAGQLSHARRRRARTA